MHRDVFVAATRFGLGARPGDLHVIAPDPRGWLSAQLEGSDPTSEQLSHHGSSRDAIRAYASMRMLAEVDKAAARKDREAVFREEMAARCVVSATTELPFRERWVRYWSNHFTVSATRKEVVALAGPYEREAIRPHCTGRFVELLQAAVLHPAMLLYLDNVRSVGPGSRAGRSGRRGLNENLAREVLELHTLGVSGGYAQADVEALARILTGWSVEPSVGGTQFSEKRHEPGRKRLLGKTYGEGHEGALAALEALSRHPATARNVATRLARHFIDDAPQPAAVDAIAKVFLDSEGDLVEVARAVIAQDAAWTPLTKVKSPEDLVLSTARALGYGREGEPMLTALRWLGQVPFSATSPQGFPDTAEGWLGPEALLTRIEWAEDVAGQAAHRVSALELAEEVLGPVLDTITRRAIASASPREALALLLASPTFQRR